MRALGSILMLLLLLVLVALIHETAPLERAIAGREYDPDAGVTDALGCP